MGCAVLILGIARSGTSAVSGALAAAGLPFGDRLKPPDWQNPKGNQEDGVLSTLNQKVLKTFGAKWSTARPLPAGWMDDRRIRSLQDRIASEIEAEFGDKPIFGLKDPRLVPLYPLYERLLREAGREIWLVTVERAEAEVVASIRASGYFHGWYFPWRGRRLYRHYRGLITALRADPGSVHLRYDELLKNPEATLARLVNALPMTEAGLKPDIGRGASFIEPLLWRNRADKESFSSVSSEKVTLLD